jgi:hypothetical protein
MMDYVWTCTLRFWTFLDLLLSPINQIALILDWIWTSAISSPKYQIRKAVTEVTKLRSEKRPWADPRPKYESESLNSAIILS